jgi:hypothetical protein
MNQVSLSLREAIGAAAEKFNLGITKGLSPINSFKPLPSCDI